ncbi:MAG: hypothetical protein IKM28_10855 [Lachnospiraceae bacterium]|nr:hypothetical protein [Lachnospiraceae bacterium]
MATGKNPIAVGDLHGFLHRNGEGTEQLRKRFDKQTVFYSCLFFNIYHLALCLMDLVSTVSTATE